MAEPEKSKFFTYEDGDGHVFVVDSLEQIPAKYREIAKQLSLEDARREIAKLEKKGLKDAKEVQREVGDVIPFVKDLDLPSVAVGFASAMVMVLAVSIVKRIGRFALKVALIVVILSLLVFAYLGWLRRAAGLSDDALASPKAIIEDAKKAKDGFQKRLDDQEESLKKIGEDR
jgi:hypothetical protein